MVKFDLYKNRKAFNLSWGENRLQQLQIFL